MVTSDVAVANSVGPGRVTVTPSSVTVGPARVLVMTEVTLTVWGGAVTVTNFSEVKTSVVGTASAISFAPQDLIRMHLPVKVVDTAMVVGTKLDVTT